MSKLRDAAQQAQQALEDHAKQYPHMQKGYTVDAITALRTALAEPEPRNQCGETCERAKLCAVCAGGLAEQEPVAWCDQYEGHIDGLRHYSDGGSREMPLYLAPQPRRNVTYVCPCCHFSLERQE